jgi:hypothetical protein
LLCFENKYALRRRECKLSKATIRRRVKSVSCMSMPALGDGEPRPAVQFKLVKEFFEVTDMKSLITHKFFMA